MKRITIIVAFIFNSFLLKASDTLHVVTHNAETVVTDPSKGNNAYTHWAVFPSSKTAVRKIILHVNFACPDSFRCADWDYLDIISIKRTGRASNASNDFEIARMLTPYGGTFAKDWKFNWELDVTDFSLLLRDSVEIEYNHSGYEPNKDRGWKVTLDFEIIKGKPVAEPVSIQKIYNGEFLYGDSVSIEEALKPVSFDAAAGASFAKFKIYQTGHGANEEDGCGEFCSKKREIFFNGTLIDSGPVWKKCGDNPLYPQAGTWIYDRANWCPGYLQQPDEYLLPLQAQNNIDVNMEPYRTKKTDARENIAAYIIQYKKAVTKNDAAVTDIIVPSTKSIHARKNPSCGNAIIRIKNNGTNVLKQLTVTYGTAGQKMKTYQWKGELAFDKQTEITLPGGVDGNEQKNVFMVSLSKPNGRNDEFNTDNKMASVYSKVNTLPQAVVLVLKTNEQPQHNSYVVTGSNGDTLYSKTFDSTQKNKWVKDTFQLKPGCYQLNIADTAGDGLEFWYNTAGGRGFVRLQNEKGMLLKQFDSDFGSGVLYNFKVSANEKEYDVAGEEIATGLFPTYTTGKTSLDFYSAVETDVTVQIVTGENNLLVEEHQYKKIKEAVFNYDLSYRPAQRYYVKVLVNGVLKYNKRLRVVDKMF